MADIDKSLPNELRTEVEIPAEEEVVEEEVVEQGPVEVIPEEDGGVTLDFEPGAINVPGTENHFDNLADILPEDILEPIGNEMVDNYMEYKSSRKDWEQSYIQGSSAWPSATPQHICERLHHNLHVLSFAEVAIHRLYIK